LCQAVAAQRFGLSRRGSVCFKDKFAKCGRGNYEIAAKAVVWAGEENLLGTPAANLEEGLDFGPGNPGWGSGVAIVELLENFS